MRGYPLVNLLLALAAVLALAIPLSSLSRDKETKAAEIVTSPISKDFVSTNVTVKLAHPAAAASLWADGTAVQTWQPTATTTTLDTKVALPLVEQVMEFELRVTWPEGTPQSVAEVHVEPEGLESRTQNVWGTGTAEEVLTFTWK